MLPALLGTALSSKTDRFDVKALFSTVARRLLVIAALVALVTGAIFGLREVAPVLSLGGLYVFAVLPVAAPCQASMRPGSLRTSCLLAGAA